MIGVPLSNRFSLARVAYRRKDIAMAERAHSAEHLGNSLHDGGARGEHLADAVLGATDGIVTTFAVAAGAAGAYLSPGVVLVLGFANLLADGFSMAVGNYLGARSQQEYWREERKRELWEIEHLPEAEREEIRRLYRDKGFEGETLERIVVTITGDKRRWTDEMMREELGIQEEKITPVASSLVTFAAFVAAGLVPLLSYLWAFLAPSAGQNIFSLSIELTAVALFLVGSARCLLTHRSWWQSGIEILGVGGLAAACAYVVGYFLRGLVG